METKRAVVFGCRGQLGIELVTVLAERGYQVTGLDRTQVDISDSAQVEQAFAREDPAIVINAAAYNQVDIAEKEPAPAMVANGLAVRNLAMAAGNMTRSSCIFRPTMYSTARPGARTPKKIATHPLGAYAVSKLAGELYAQAYLDNPLIIRTSGVFGPGGLKTPRGNFIELMLRLAANQQAGSNKQPIRVVDDHVASPTYAPLLAARSADLLDRGLTGVFHIGGGQPISWFDYASMIFRIAGLHPGSKAHQRARIPHRRAPPEVLRSFERARWNARGIEPFPPLETAVRLYMEARAQRLGSATINPGG